MNRSDQAGSADNDNPCPPKNEGTPDGDQFPATQWSAIIQGSEAGSHEHDRAWENLARSYWKPLYTFLRGRGCDHHTASDDIQGFFEHLLKKDFLRRVERGDGRFRSFLLTSLQNWRRDQHRAATAQKRGSGKKPLSLEELEEAARTVPSAATESPEEAFDRSWARTAFQNALGTLEDRMKSRGRGSHFGKLQGVLTGENTAKYQDIAADLGMKEGAVKQAALDLRREFGRVLRDEIRRTVALEEQVDDEIRYLLELSQA
ncbi:MAG: RNA polymerase subunit sigma-24 [Verrucomicrobiota bacterium]